MNRRLIGTAGIVAALAVVAGGCSAAVEETTVTSEIKTVASSETTTVVPSTTTEETSEETTTTELPVDVNSSQTSIHKVDLFNTTLPLPEGIDYIHSCYIREGTVFSDDLFDGYYSVGDVHEGCPASCDYVFVFYDRYLSDEVVEAYIETLSDYKYTGDRSYNGWDYRSETDDGIRMGLDNYTPSDAFPHGRAVIIFASNPDNEDGFFCVG
jgi:hypothetical protein